MGSKFIFDFWCILGHPNIRFPNFIYIEYQVTKKSATTNDCYFIEITAFFWIVENKRWLNVAIYTNIAAFEAKLCPVYKNACLNRWGPRSRVWAVRMLDSLINSEKMNNLTYPDYMETLQ